MVRGGAVTLAALAVGLVAAAPPAATTDEPLPPYVVAAAWQGGVGYVNEVVAVRVGGPLTLLNLDVFRHDVVSAVAGPSDQSWCGRFAGACPLFASDLVSALPTTGGPATRVRGLENLVAGESYAFYCSIHADMQGLLVALPGP